MTKQLFGPLGEIDLLTDSELKATLGHHFSHMIREWYRGIDYMMFAGQGNGTGLITLPNVAPDQGYSWNYKLVGAQLSAAGVLSIYPGDNTNTAAVGVTTAVANGTNFDAVYTWSSNQLVLKDQRNLTLLSQVTINWWRVLVEQVPTEMQGKF